MTLNLDVPAFDGPALCAETDPDSFFPDKGHSVAAAKKVCGGCPVKDECLQWALDRDERFGVWGGLSERERRRLHGKPTTKRARQAECGTASGYRAHKRLGEESCEACSEANRTYNREWQHRTGRRTPQAGAA